MDLAAIGFGVAGVTEEFVRRELESGRLRKLRTSFDIPPRSVDLCVLRDVPLTSAAQRFSDFIRESLRRGCSPSYVTKPAPEMPGTSPFRPLAFIGGIGQNNVIIHSNVKLIGGVYGTAEGAYPPGG